MAPAPRALAAALLALPLLAFAEPPQPARGDGPPYSASRAFAKYLLFREATAASQESYRQGLRDLAGCPSADFTAEPAAPEGYRISCRLPRPEEPRTRARLEHPRPEFRTVVLGVDRDSVRDFNGRFRGYGYDLDASALTAADAAAGLRQAVACIDDGIDEAVDRPECP